MATMKAAFVRQGKAGIVKARAVEDQLMRESWQVDSYDLLPKVQTLSIPTLVIWGDHDFIPGEIAMHIARAIPHAQLVTLKNCGHFAFLECPGDVRNAFNDFFRDTRATEFPH
jgi:proline iminopeptidase